MNDHTMTVTFDDDHLALDNVVKALGEAGYTVPSYAREGER